MRSTDGRILSLGRVASVLGAASLLLAVALLAQAEILFPRQTDGAPPSAPRALDPPELAMAAIWPDASKITADGHSLFFSKIPIAAQPTTPAAPPLQERPPEQLALEAIVIAPSGKFALLRAQQSQELTQLREGTSAAGWVLAAVEDDRVVLEKGDQQTILYLPDTIPGKR